MRSISSLQLFCFLLILFVCSINKTYGQISNPAGDSVFSKVETEASFPGGYEAWAKYVGNAFNNADVKWKNSDEGTCNIRFVVDKSGFISDVHALNMKKTRLAKFAVEIIQNGPRWKPASQDGKFVKAFREQPITFAFAKEPRAK